MSDAPATAAKKRPTATIASSFKMAARGRATLHKLLRPFALGIGGSAILASSSSSFSSSPSSSGGAPVAPGKGVPAAGSLAAPGMGLLVVASSAPLFGISTIGAASVLRGLGGIKWLSRPWERAAWGTLFASGAVLAVSRPLSLLAREQSGESGAALAATDTATRVCTVSAGASLLATIAAERLGSYFGAALFVPAMLGSVGSALLLPEMPLSAFAPAPALMIPFMLCCSPPVFTRSADLLVVGLWSACALAPALAELGGMRPGTRAGPGAGDGAAAQPPRAGAGDDKVAARLAYEQVMGAMVLFWVHAYLLRRRPIWQY